MALSMHQVHALLPAHVRTDGRMYDTGHERKACLCAGAVHAVRQDERGGVVPQCACQRPIDPAIPGSNDSGEVTITTTCASGIGVGFVSLLVCALVLG